MSAHPGGWVNGPGPQDAPSETPVGPATPGPVASREQTPPQRPRGPNWGLVLLGLLLVLVAAAVVVTQLTGLDPTPSMEQRGPLVFVAVGIGCALVGVVGMLRRDS